MSSDIVPLIYIVFFGIPIVVALTCITLIARYAIDHRHTDKPLELFIKVFLALSLVSVIAYAYYIMLMDGSAEKLI